MPNFRERLRHPVLDRIVTMAYTPVDVEIVSDRYAGLSDLGIFEKFEGDPQRIVRYSSRRYVIRYDREIVTATFGAVPVVLTAEGRVWTVLKAREVTEFGRESYLELECETRLG